ncbi:MAG: hypothetical protein ACXWLR_14370 [Myxococcales bacterium]
MTQSTITMLIAGCLIDAMIVLALSWLTDGRRSARVLYGGRRAPLLRSVR